VPSGLAPTARVRARLSPLCADIALRHMLRLLHPATRSTLCSCEGRLVVGAPDRKRRSSQFRAGALSCFLSVFPFARLARRAFLNSLPGAACLADNRLHSLDPPVAFCASTALRHGSYCPAVVESMSLLSAPGRTSHRAGGIACVKRLPALQ